MPDHSLSKELLPDIQPKSLLAELKPMPSCPAVGCLGEEANPHLATTSFQYDLHMTFETVCLKVDIFNCFHRYLFNEMMIRQIKFSFLTETIMATLVVNVASYCQYTDKNYIALQELHREFGPSHFTVLAFPCNQFGESEPSSSQEIESFAKGNYGVTFPVFHKIKILGSEADPAFKFLIDSSKKEPRWNFWKYLVSPEGKVVKFWRPEEPIQSIKPEVASLIRQIIMKKREDL
ncbi:putative glutathione peroxidase 8 [Willisornis vidua]|uniref:Glutathione peroxidase n=1 Tax=Willisornis vidua TaxID=1566151 RepID=A0ABQ9D9Z2_9PASS|nr:putative glutathione peroxidase 8 [Willisornis vidua]